MRQFRSLILIFLFLAPVAALSALSIDDFPGTSKWYFHADFKQMRSSDAGQHLYAWLQDEVFEDIREDAGVDLDKEADYLTAFATEDDGMVIVIEGKISQETEDKLVAMGAASGSLNRHGSGRKAYYHIKDDDDVDFDGDDISIDVDSFDNGAYFSFAVNNKLIVTSTQEKMEALLESKGRFEGVRSERGQLFVLSAERGLIQAGARTAEFDGNGDWDSNILRNTEHAALLVADKKGKISIEAQLITTEPEMAESLASIVRGLISLQVFNDDMDPEFSSFLQNTNVNVDDKKLTISVALDPEVVVAAID
ncbi:MAG: hypothetical protein KJP17_08245 [Gammaproteobacteria bacterium]|nr:hypothetical protein [Gammaproteobacteria bacterium]